MNDIYFEDSLLVDLNMGKQGYLTSTFQDFQHLFTSIFDIQDIQ